MGYGLQILGRDDYEKLMRERQMEKRRDCPFCNYKSMLRIFYCGKYWIWAANGFPYWPYHTRRGSWKKTAGLPRATVVTVARGGAAVLLWAWKAGF